MVSVKFYGHNNRSAAGGRRNEVVMAQRSKFIGATSRNEFWAPQEGVYMGGNSQIAGQSPITPSESATASFDSLMDVKSAFALLLTKVTKLETKFILE